ANPGASTRELDGATAAPFGRGGWDIFRHQLVSLAQDGHTLGAFRDAMPDARMLGSSAIEALLGIAAERIRALEELGSEGAARIGERATRFTFGDVRHASPSGEAVEQTSGRIRPPRRRPGRRGSAAPDRSNARARRSRSRRAPLW